MDANPWSDKLNPREPADRAALWSAHQDAIERVVAFHTFRSEDHPALAFLEDDDLAQEMRMAIWRECHQFNPNRGSFPTFADRIARSTVRALIRQETAECRDHRRTGPSLNATPWEAHSPTTQDHQRPDDAEREALAPAPAAWPAEWVDVLPAPLKSVAELLVHHSEYKVSKLLGLSRRHVRDCIIRIGRVYEARRLRGEL
jgi:RNA polymerase sigma factor (sigma-70 family)